jgi:hypothetical protein
MLAGVAGGASVVLQIMASIKPGTTTKSLAFEEAQTDNAAALSVVKMATGCMANGFSLSITPDAIVNANFDFMGKIFAVASTRALAAAAATALNAGVTIAESTSWPAAPTNAPMTANDTLMQLMVNNVSVGVVTALTINGSNGLEEMFPVGSLVPYAVGKGDSVVTGTMDIYMTDTTYWSAYQNETTMGLTVRLMDPTVTDIKLQATGTGYAIDIPNVKLSGLSESKDKTKVIHNVQWSAIKNAAATTAGKATVNMSVSRLV